MKILRVWQYVFAIISCLIWILSEDKLRKLILSNKQDIIFLIDPKPISIYTLIFVVLIVAIDISKIKDIERSYWFENRTFCVLCVASFILPLLLIQARTEVTEKKITVYNVTGNVVSTYDIAKADYAVCKLDYEGSEDIPYNGVKFCYELHFSDSIIKIYSSYKKSFWKNINILNSKVLENSIEKRVAESNYIDIVNQFNRIDQLCNYPFGVYSHIQEIETIMAVNT